MRDLLELLGTPVAGESLILGGPSGSGKTEAALNVAMSIAQDTTLRGMLCDLDVVKPYFRLRDMIRLLPIDITGRVQVVGPEHRLLHADIPIFPSNLHALLADEKTIKVIDVGGDVAGIGAIAQFRETILAKPYRFYILINTCRPGMGNLPAMVRTFQGIVQGARLEVKGLISNTNLQDETRASDVQAGFDLMQKLGEATGLPVVAVLADQARISALEPGLSPETRRLLAGIRVFNRIFDSVSSQTEF